MKRIILSIIVAGIWGLCFCASPAQAEPITIAIEAEVDSVEDVGGYLEGKIKPGDIITGAYTYDSSTPDSSPLDPIVGHYYHYASPAGISLSVGGFTFATNPSNVDFSLGVTNNGSSADVYYLFSANNLRLSNGFSINDILWQLNDSTAHALSSDALPLTAPLLDLWDSNYLLIQGGPRSSQFDIQGHVTSAIPEPGTVMLLTLGGLIVRRRTKR